MTPIPGPIILLALPLLAAVATYVVRRWALLASLVAALTTAILAFLCFRLPLTQSAFVLGQEVAFGRPVVIAGRELILASTGQVWLGFVFGLATVLFLFAWRSPQGRGFYSMSLIILGLYSLMTLLQSFALSAIVLGISAAMAVFLLQSEARPSVRGAERYLQVVVLAIPLLLAAAWLNEQGSPSSLQAMLPAAIGFGLLMAIFPFGTWMPALSAEAPPLATALVFSAGQAMALYLLLSFVDSAPWLLSHTNTAHVVLVSGLIMAFAGGLVGAVQRDWSRVLGYAALSDLGLVLLGLISGGSQDRVLALLHLVNRSVAITLMAMSLSVLRQHAEDDRFDRLRGVAQRLPIATLGLLVGGLSLAGFPFTLGFASRWAIVRSALNRVEPLATVGEGQGFLGFLSTVDEPWLWIAAALALVISSAGVVVGLLRGLSAMLGDGSEERTLKQPTIASWMILALIVFTLAAGLVPQLFLEPVSAAAGVSTLFLP